MEIGKGRAEIVASVVLGENLVCGIQVPPVLHFFVEATHECFVVLNRHAAPHFSHFMGLPSHVPMALVLPAVCTYFRLQQQRPVVATINTKMKFLRISFTILIIAHACLKSEIAVTYTAYDDCLSASCRMSRLLKLKS